MFPYSVANDSANRDAVDEISISFTTPNGENNTAEIGRPFKIDAGVLINLH